MVVTADTVIHELLGSCKSLYEVLEFHEAEHLELDSAFCAEIDSQIFCCESCNWWMEISDMTDDGRWICEECADDDL